MMVERVIKIEPVTRVEGHCAIKLMLNEDGSLQDAQTKILETRGFEKFVQGRLIEEMPLILPKICGICHVPHHVCSGKAVDSAFGLNPTDIPKTAFMLRELLHYGSYIHSHILHFFYLAAPDFIIGPDSPPEKRNVFGILKVNPDLVKKVIKARAVGQKITQTIGGKRVHPVTCVPGGQAAPLTPEKRDVLLGEAKWVRDTFLPEALDVVNPIFDQYASEIDTLGAIEVGNLGIISNKGALDFYDGKLRSTSPDGVVLDDFEVDNYFDYVTERVQDWSYLKFPYFKKLGWPDGIYRVGPLGRLNVADYIPTQRAQEMFKEFRNKWGRPINKTLLYNFARLIETMFAAEYCVDLLEDPAITGSKIRLKVELQEGDGIACVEAHRGTLIHHYSVDKNGIMKDCNLIVATVGNNGAINKAVKAAAFDLIRDSQPAEGLLNRLEMVVRAYDPCFSCATHAIRPGHVATKVEIVDFRGNSLHTLRNWKLEEVNE